MRTTFGKDSLASRLTRHFAASAAVCIALPLASAGTASAQVQHAVVNWVVPANTSGLYINVETGASGSSGGVVPGWDLNPYGSTSLTWFQTALVPPMMLRAIGATSGSAGSLALGAIVGPSGSFGAGAVTVGSGGWQLNASNYFGFKFSAADGQTRYGWGRFVIGPAINGGDRRIAEVAWELLPNTPIVVGDTGAGSYDPCSTLNPTLASGANAIELNQSTAPDLDLSSTACAFTVRKANFLRYTPIATGSHVFSTCASGAATRIAVVSDCANPAASVIACNDNACGSSASVTVNLTEGSPVFIVVGGESADIASPLAVSVTTPTLPACVAATNAVFGSNPFDNAASTAIQSVKGNATGTYTTSIYKPVWFRFVPSVNGAYSFTTCGSAGDTVIAVGTGCPAAGNRFENIAFNDDAPCTAGGPNTDSSFINANNNGAPNSEAFPTSGFPLTGDLVAGQAYLICVGSFTPFASSSGALVIDGPPQTAPEDLNADGTVGAQDLAILLGNWGGSGIGDIDGDGVVGAQDLAALLAAWS